ncbi:CDP-glucose 4,6-dehydratase [Roseateles sp.]|jgi:CDP-glucose 4,6-dehydratase|uniref:CDP-glucose 4,6-dehydratase n=1 Tax=Roseateles sp. TaxID=1971397 RepID=UPI0037C80C23
MRHGTVDPEFWRGKCVLLSGHTGFKGSWLALWLQSMGAEVHGLALEAPTTPALFAEARVAAGMATSTIGDIRNLAAVQRAMAACRPEIVLHLAAQPLVRLSYQEPVETYATNVMGTVHILEAARQVGTVRAIVNVTTDKCYENREWVWGYREDEPMGGHDPYSNSKGCAELVTSAYRRAFMAQGGIALASARAGNVIGGGDWAADRLVPDVLRAFEKGEPVQIRNPHATRPWQHVLEPLSGYLMLAERLYLQGQTHAEGWNFGPRDQDVQPVQWIVEHLVAQWGRGAGWTLSEGEHPHEANYLKLDISKARHGLSWEPRWNLGQALERIVEWHQAWLTGQDMQALCLQQITTYSSDL